MFDGSPQFRPISGTPLQYVVNSPTPIIGVDATTSYALRAGVWFTTTSQSGPWIVAASVPQVIYTIPVSSPLYYVTYVRVYGATPEVVYVGYTPGYLGTVVAADGWSCTARGMPTSRGSAPHGTPRRDLRGTGAARL